MHSLIGGVISGAHCLSPSMLATGMVLYTYSFRRCHVQRTSKIFGIYFHIQIQRELHVFSPFARAQAVAEGQQAEQAFPEFIWQAQGQKPAQEISKEQRSE